MGTKLAQKEYPSGHGPSDFDCFGPPATKDSEFEGTMICDCGCFTQDGKDSNKFYHAAVVQSKKTQAWFAYFEWGRTGASNPAFQFVQCSSKTEAENEYASQLHSKNDKRGQWTTLAGKRVLQAKPGKDCYLVRPQATRSTGLPSAKTITMQESIVKAQAVKGTNGNGDKKDSKIKKSSKPAITCDPQTLALMRDLNVATMSYTRSAMADAALPTLDAINEARDILIEAQKRVVKVGNHVDDQINDNDLKQLTYTLYMRIPKIKERNAAASTWILSQNNIFGWQQDLDAFESALATKDFGDIEVENDPLSGMPVKMEWVDPRSSVGEFIHNWAPKATANKHSWCGAMKLKNVWKIERTDQWAKKFAATQEKILADKPRITERPLFQPKDRPDLDRSTLVKYVQSNTGLLFHGTRSVNVSGILREFFRLPKQLVGVVITGAMFGGGVYKADDWKKSAGYCSLGSSYWAKGSGGVKGREAFMFACDVVLGQPHVAPGPRGYTGPPAGCHCVFGKAGTSQVQNNEWIVFDAAQINMRYLFEFAA